ncbi:MAG: PadR family transcriptional regulator [Actinomycetota bacterium]|nr:PadR family transcriptional regulator [Actinomycetota bacterium]
MTSLIGDTKINALGMVALGLLTEGPRHPYEMYQVLVRRREDVIVKLSPGSLYHAIAKLAESGLVRATGTERDGNRPERTTYEVTRDGRQVLESIVVNHLAHPVNEFPIFPVAVAQAQRLPKADVLQHFKYRLSVLERELSVMKAGYQELIDGGKARHVILDLDYLIVMRASEIAWLTTTLTALESGELEWTTG